MTVLAGKLRDFFSDLWFSIDMILTRTPKVKEAPPSPPPTPQVQQAASGIMPVTANLPHNPDGLARLMDIRAKQSQEKKEHIKNARYSFGLKHLRLNKKSRLAFYDQMSTLVGSGVPLIDSLSLIQAQERNKSVKELYAEMIHEINGGLSLAESMQMFPSIFPAMQSALVEAAEASGNLKEVLAELVEEMESSQEFMKKVTGAMFYPVILLCMALILVTGMMTFVIPKIASMYEQADVDLPALTQSVIDISHFTLNHWKILLLAIIAGAAGIYMFFSKVLYGRLLWEKFISMIPVVGRIAKEKNIMIIASNMAMLMKSGVLITEAFAITKNTLSNLHYQKALERIRQGVIMGKEVSQMMGLIDIRTQQFKEDRLFPLQVAQMIHIGEKTGNIANMLFKIKKNYQKSIDYTLRNISTLVEPLMIFIVAGLVGTILMAVMLPFFYIGSTIS